MSLINQMLTDLDQRHAAQVNDASDQGTPYIPHAFSQTVQAPGSNRKTLFIKLGASAFIATLVAITGYYSYLIYTQRLNAVAPITQMQPKTKLTQKTTPKIIPVQSKSKQGNLATPALPVIVSANTNVRAAEPIAVQRTAAPTTGLNINTVDDEPIVNNQSVIAATDENVSEQDFNTDLQSVKKQQLQLSPAQQAEVAYQQGYELLQQNKIYSAESKLLLALEHNVKHIKAREMLVGLYLKTGRKVEAQSILVTGLLHLPGYSNFTKLYARLLLDNNQADKAVKVLLQHKPAIASDPNYFALLAASYQRQKNHNAAANTYVELLKLNPREGIWWVGMAISLEALHKNQDALHAYEKARQTGTLNTHISNYSSQRLQQLQLGTEPSAQ